MNIPKSGKSDLSPITSPLAVMSSADSLYVAGASAVVEVISTQPENLF